MKNTDYFSRVFNHIIILTILFSLNTVVKSQEKIILYDIYHGENRNCPAVFQKLIPDNLQTDIMVDSSVINDSLLNGKSGLILFSPTRKFQSVEKESIQKYLNSGGSLLLFFDQESRMSLSEVGINDIIIPFGLELTSDAPVRHNCGAVAEKSEVCAELRELPYSGGRSIIGGSVISKVFDEGNYVHCAYEKLPGGGKLIVFSDAMVGLLLGRPDGERFHGTSPSDSKYWGKDSRIFMEEILSFFIK